MCSDESAVDHGAKPQLRLVEVAVGAALLGAGGALQQPPDGALFAVTISNRQVAKAVAIVGRPVPPAGNDGFTLEVTRVRTDGSVAMEVAVYRAIWQLVRLRGYRRLITHTELASIRRGLAGVGLVPVAAVPARAGASTPPQLQVGRGVDGARRVQWEMAGEAFPAAAPGYASTAATIPLAVRSESLPAQLFRRGRAA